MERKHQNPKRTPNAHTKLTVSNRKSTQGGKSKSLELAKKEVRTTADYGRLMAALITDVIEEKVSPTVLNAAVNAGRQLIKAAEFNLKYGRRNAVNIKLKNRKKEISLDLLTGDIV